MEQPLCVMLVFLGGARNYFFVICASFKETFYELVWWQKGQEECLLSKLYVYLCILFNIFFTGIVLFFLQG